MTSLIKQELDEWLDQVDYEYLNSLDFKPSAFAIQFMNFIKMVNGSEGESHKTPPMHLAMLDKVIIDAEYIANLCFRGAAKTTLFAEYFFPFVAFMGELPGLGDVSGAIYVSDSMDNGVKSLRRNMEFRYQNSPFLQKWLPKATFTDAYIEFENIAGHRFGLKMFGAQTGLRGTKIFGKRPVLCVLDDLVSDDDSKSQASMMAIKDTVYKGVNHALDPTRRKVIFNGTPFNKEDILIEAVESGQWVVNVWPVCERFPCERDEFKGAWEDRFSYDYVKAQYELAVGTGKLAAFMQELMLRITSEEERLVQDAEIKYFPRMPILQNRQNFNFYITTDFATSSKQTADFSVISVWAYGSNGDWFWVDGICERQTMDKTVDDLFRFVQFYKPLEVGIEVTGQQGGFIPWLQNEMLNRNVWFNFASSSKAGNSPGIRPQIDKLSRFQVVLPWFKMGKVYWPEEMKTSPIMGKFIGQLRLVTVSGIKGKDDCIDTISMLQYIKAWKPAAGNPVTQEEMDIWEDAITDDSGGSLSNYVV